MEPPASGPAKMSKVGLSPSHPGIVKSGGVAGFWGGDDDGAVAKQKGMSTVANQSAGEGDGEGDGDGGAGGGAGGMGPFVHVVHFGSCPIDVIAANGLKYAGPSAVSCEKPAHFASASHLVSISARVRNSFPSAVVFLHIAVLPMSLAPRNFPHLSWLSQLASPSVAVVA